MVPTQGGISEHILQAKYSYLQKTKFLYENDFQPLQSGRVKPKKVGSNRVIVLHVSSNVLFY